MSTANDLDYLRRLVHRRDRPAAERRAVRSSPAPARQPRSAAGPSRRAPRASASAAARASATTFARVLGFTQFTASAEATAVTGALTGGEFLPVVFPVSLANCDGSGNTIVTDEPWRLSDPNPDPNLPPIGQEYIVPLCKTGAGVVPDPRPRPEP